jgi:hypothetical protein
MSRCRELGTIDRHFAGTISVAAERAMREHVGTCDACRRYYQRHLLLEQVVAEPIGPERRLAIGLGLRRRSRSWLPVTAAATLALAGVLIVVSVSRPDRIAMTERGAQTADTVVGFRIRGGDHQPVARLGELAPDDELAFAYAASGEHRYLAVFGIDDAGRFYWYFPAWTDAAHVPAAIRVEPAPSLVELSEAIRHDLRGHRLWIYAAFLDRAWTTVEIEARAPAPGDPIMLDAPVAPRYSLAVTP